MSFAHLHTHTAYSLLDGEGTIKKIVDRAKELGQTAMAITDHGNMYGVIEFYEYAKSQGIKPILGCEVYVAARGRYDKVHEYDSISSHLILLAKNNVGYKNLMNIVSLGFTQGFYYKPRIDMEVLRENSEGIIALSACMFGVLSRNILSNNYEEAKRKATEFVDIFGRDNYFIEIQDHGIYEQKRLNRELIAISKELDLKLVATNDIHYVMKKDAEYQDVLMCIQMCKNVDDEDRMKMSTDELYVKSEDEMRELFGYVPEAIENTQKVADMCEVEIEFGKLHLPEFSLPEGVNAFEYLKNLCINGMEKRYPNADDAIKNRLKYELETIKSMGYVDYFLIVWDFIHYAKSHDIPVGPGRGSGAGSICAYSIGIT
ncbi:MAG: DNA polymerase III subunit alpha, partial [Oscillospiraceae bacterium]